MRAPDARSRLFLLIALHLAIVLPLAYFLNIWIDEASSLYATRDGFVTAFHTAAVEQKQAPLYFWLLSLWREIDGSIFFARLFSALCAVLAITQFAAIARRFLTPERAVWAAAFFGLHPYLIWSSLEVRVYSLTILLSLVLIASFYRAFMDKTEPHRLGRRVIFLAVVIASLYTSYYLGFVIAGCFAVLIITRRWREAAVFAGLGLVAAVAAIPLVRDLVHEFSSKTGGYQDPKDVVTGLRILWSHFTTFAVPFDLFPVEERSLASIARVWTVRAAAVGLVAVVAIKRRELTRQTFELAALSAAVSGFLFAAYFAVGSGYVEIRHAAVLFGPFYLTAAAVLCDVTRGLSHGARKAFLGMGVVVYLAVFGYAMVNEYAPLAKRGDWARVGSFIQSNESAGQPILVFTTFDALTLPYHYRGVNAVLPDERYFDFITPQAKPGSLESLQAETEFALSELPAGVESFWLVVNEKCFSGEACTPLQNYVSANYTIEIEKSFYYEKVYLLRRKQQ